MENYELIHELTKITNFDYQERFELIKLLWREIVQLSDFGYGQDMRIINSLTNHLNELKNIVIEEGWHIN